MKKLGAILSVGCLGLLFSLNTNATNFGYSNIEVGAERFYFKDSSNVSDGSSLGVKLGYQFHPNLFTRLTVKRYSYSVSNSDVTPWQLALGLGVAVPISDSTDLFGFIEMGEMKYESCGSLANCHDDYLKTELGLRHWVSPNLEINAAYHHYQNSRETYSDYEIPIGVSFWLDPKAALKLGYIYSPDVVGVSLGYEYRF